MLIVMAETFIFINKQDPTAAHEIAVSIDRAEETESGVKYFVLKEEETGTLLS